MNYRHAYHAGNFADVFKHALLARILLYLTRKPAPLRYIDTHAGIGLYDLSGVEAQKTGEWRGGIGRMGAIPEGPARELLQPWIALASAARYPGSPVLAQSLLRAGDSLRLCELHARDADDLDVHMGRDSRVKILVQDGYTALKGLVPPPSRRGLVLMDPPFEANDEFDRMAKAVIEAHARWREGVFALWYPVKDAAGQHFGAKLAQAGIRKILRLRLNVGGETAALTACAMIVINPPFVLEAETAVLLPALVAAMRQGPGAGYAVDWLAGE